MRLSEKLKMAHESGDFGLALEGYAEQSLRLEDALESLISTANLYRRNNWDYLPDPAIEAAENALELPQ